jgi:hypothetical protein
MDRVSSLLRHDGRLSHCMQSNRFERERIREREWWGIIIRGY